jgi:ribonuclease T2
MPLSRTLLTSALMCVALGASAQQFGHGREAGEPGRFDHYAVALSWSPSYCATHDDASQCSTGRQLGFVLHGLWPQYEKGYPQQCSTERLPERDKQRYAPLFPSPKMIGHQWSKHGTCSGLNPAAYFELSEKLQKQLVIPAPYQRPAQPVRASYGEFVQTFRAVNPRLADHSVLPFCADGGRFLREIHVCYDKRGASASCSDGEIRRSMNTCRKGTFVMQSVR